MTPTGLPPAFADGLRAALMEEVRASAAPTKAQGKTRRRWFLGAGCAAIIAIGRQRLRGQGALPGQHGGHDDQ